MRHCRSPLPSHVAHQNGHRSPGGELALPVVVIQIGESGCVMMLPGIAIDSFFVLLELHRRDVHHIKDQDPLFQPAF